jgi:dTDP-4-dehydrorhamnose reductase
MKRVLLFGSLGQIGGYLEPLLGAIGPVVAPSPEEADFRDPGSLRRVVAATDPAVIVNAAAYTDVDGAEREEHVAAAINAEAPRVLAEEAAARGAILVHYSTDYVFDGRGERPYREDDTPAPLGAYGRTKRAGEEGVLAVGGRALVLRTSWVYGLTGRNFLLTMQRLAAQGGPLRVVDDQRGSPTWSRAVAAATVAVLQRALDGSAEGWGLFHMTCGGETSWYGFARAILGTGVEVRPVTTAEFPRPAPRPGYSVLDCGRLQRVFGVRLPAWEDALRACLAGEPAA